MEFTDFLAGAVITLGLATLASATGLLTAHYVYEGKLYGAINEDFTASAGLEADDVFNCYKKTENGKDYLVADVVAKDGTVWNMVWDATGYDYSPAKSVFPSKGAANIIKSEDPVSVEKYDLNQEM